MKKIAVILSGCGNRDGAEITEAVSTFICLSKLGVQYEVFAPNVSFSPTNHHLGDHDVKGEIRNCITESARISRGQVTDLSLLKESYFDGLVIPGGYGAALHLSNWAQKGALCTVNPDLEKAIRAFHESSKPIGAICIAPAILAVVLGKEKISVTLGDNKEVANEINKTGATHVECPVNDYITDRLHKIITTPAYMYNTQPHLVFEGISGLISELVEMS